MISRLSSSASAIVSIARVDSGRRGCAAVTYACPRTCAATVRTGRVSEDACDRVGVELATSAGSVHDLHTDFLEPVEDTLACFLVGLAFTGRDLEWLLGPIAARPTMSADRSVTPCTSPPTPFEFSP